MQILNLSTLALQNDNWQFNFLKARRLFKFAWFDSEKCKNENCQFGTSPKVQEDSFSEGKAFLP
jgi:hypothetical protein